MMKRAAVAFAATIGLLTIATTVMACEFQFNYSEISAPLGAFGEVAVRVEKDHNNCTLPSMDDYQFTWENIQPLGETAWEEVGFNLYEKWFQVSLSQIGDGYLKISKDCTKEGYEEAILPITVLEPAKEGVWHQAYEGAYPLEVPEIGTLESVIEEGVVIEGTLTIEQMAIDLPTVPTSFDGELGSIRLFFARTSDEEIVPLLIVSERFFLRFDHFISDET